MDGQDGSRVTGSAGGAAARPLRIGVHPVFASLPPTTSVGRIWHQALTRLADRARLVVADPTRSRWRWRPRVDVWLTEGHQGPVPVREPVVAHLHEATWADPQLRPLFEPAFLAQHEQPSSDAARAATRILTVSASSKAQIVAAYDVPPDRVHVAHNGVDHATYRPGVPGAAELIARAGGDPDAPYVLFVSSVHPRKNLALLRGAVGELAARGLEVRLVLVAGPSPDRADSGELAAAAVAPIPGVAGPVVNLAGASDLEVAALMGGAAVFCLPSAMEGFGMSVAEAMACGTPVVVSDRGSLPEVVGEAGLVVPPEVDAVADALAAVLGDPALAAARGAAGRAYAARYSWEAMTDVWWEALTRAADGTTT